MIASFWLFGNILLLVARALRYYAQAGRRRGLYLTMDPRDDARIAIIVSFAPRSSFHSHVGTKKETGNNHAFSRYAWRWWHAGAFLFGHRVQPITGTLFLFVTDARVCVVADGSFSFCTGHWPHAFFLFAP